MKKGFMKRKNGLTLVEMLSVIIVITVMALIVTPLIMNSIKNSKNKLYETQLENIKSAAKSYMVDLDLQDNGSINITLGELEQVGYFSKNIKNPKTDELFNKCLLVTVKKNGESYEYTITNEEDTSEECGNHKSIMILYGYVHAVATYKRPYVESGVVVIKNRKKIDNRDVMVTVKKRKDGAIIDELGPYSYSEYINDLATIIDTSDYYTYEIEYSHDETASKIRYVEVKEANNLQCLIIPTTKIGPNGWIVGDNDRKAEIVSINSNKQVQYSISLSNEKNYSKNQVISADRDGATTFYGYIKDKDGNESACTSIIKYESGNPGCNIEVSGTKSATTDWYVSPITAKLIENKISPIVKRGMDYSSSNNFNGYKELIASESGIRTIYGYFVDEAGKDTQCHKPVKIDLTTNLVASINGVIEGTTTNYVSGTISTSNVNLISNINPATTVSGYNYQWYKDGEKISGATDTSYLVTTDGKYYVMVTTGSGITAKSNEIDVKIDSARPTCSLSVNNGTKGNNDWYTSNVTLGISKNDATYYGITDIEGVNYNSSTSVTLTQTGRAYCYVASRTKVNTNSNYIDVNIDKKAPVISSFSGTSLSESNYNTTSLQLIVSATDDDSGINRYEFYKVEKTHGNETYLGDSLNNIYTVTNPSVTDYKVKVYDNAGLVSETVLTESCSLNQAGTCSNGSKTDTYTCTTGRNYSVTSSEGCETCGTKCMAEALSYMSTWSCDCTSGPECSDICSSRANSARTDKFNICMTKCDPNYTPLGSGSSSGGSTCDTSGCSGWVSGCQCFPNNICNSSAGGTTHYDDDGNVTGFTPGSC